MRYSEPRRIALVEPQEVFLPHLLETLATEGLQVVGTTSTVDEKQLSALQPDIVLVDLGLTEPVSFSSLGRIRKALPKARLILFGGASNAAWRANAWAQGVDVVLTERDGASELLAAAQAS